jgi:hypothetical protein
MFSNAARFRCSVVCPLVALAVVALAGCDLGRYEARRKQAAANIAGEAQLDALLSPAITVPDKANQSTNIAIRLPKSVGTTAAAVAGVQINGLALMYEAAGGNGPMVLVGGVPAAEGPVNKVVDAITAGMQAVAPGVNPQVTDVNPNVKRFTFVGGQAFGGGQAPGRTDAVVITSASHIAVVIYRVADSANTDKSFDAAVEASIGSIQGAAPLAAPMAPM